MGGSFFSKGIRNTSSPRSLAKALTNCRSADHATWFAWVVPISVSCDLLRRMLICVLLRRICQLLANRPFHAPRRMTAIMRAGSHAVKRERVKPLMCRMGRLRPKPRITQPSGPEANVVFCSAVCGLVPEDQTQLHCWPKVGRAGLPRARSAMVVASQRRTPDRIMHSAAPSCPITSACANEASCVPLEDGDPQAGLFMVHASGCRHWSEPDNRVLGSDIGSWWNARLH
ncbi:hypothetical protein ABIF78_003644 [Bradyrhizobium japonicum]